MTRTRQNAKRSSGGLAPNVPFAASSSGASSVSGTDAASRDTGSNVSQSRKRSATTQGSQFTDQRPSQPVKRAKTMTTVQSVQLGRVEGSSGQVTGKPFVYRDQSIASLLRQLKDSGHPVYCHKCMDNSAQPVPWTTSTLCVTSVKLPGKVCIPGTMASSKLPFFKQKGKQGLTLTCKGYGPRGVKWLHPKVAVIDARLACLDGEGHPPGMVTQYLRAMMHEIKEDVRRFELVFDFPDKNPEEFLGAHQVKVNPK
ncbi:hypothetical protein BXZ70DRAFT_1013317 [Cristinia sonorae]|uniref:Uncharacterized protein n=1 Tax=Cristinia sonorae TaxID=1940300 RepID=A0A8K0UEV0_9AGAR|nr:hypothetical protein BXZ70DRAFT_1013317 [Cristinia sonorae]